MPAVKTPVMPEMLRAASLSRYSWLIHGFSTRRHGSLGFKDGDSAAAIRRNRTKFLKQLRTGTKAGLVTLQQIHSDVVHRIDAAPKSALKGAGLITNVPGLLLSI